MVPTKIILPSLSLSSIISFTKLWKGPFNSRRYLCPTILITYLQKHKSKKTLLNPQLTALTALSCILTSFRGSWQLVMNFNHQDHIKCQQHSTGSLRNDRKGKPMLGPGSGKERNCLGVPNHCFMVIIIPVASQVHLVPEGAIRSQL